MTAGVSLAGISTYFPARYQTSADIAAATGIPTDVIEHRFGLRGKHYAADDEQCPCDDQDSAACHRGHLLFSRFLCRRANTGFTVSFPDHATH